MKNYLRFLSPVMLLLMAVMFGGGKILAQTANLTFNKACGGTGTDDQKGAWDINSDAKESTYVKDQGVHYGTKDVMVSYITATTKAYSTKKITKIVVNASAADKGSPKVSCTVGGASFGTEQRLTTSNAAYTFEGTATGEIVVKVSKTKSKKALYLKSIEVTYKEDDGKTQTTLSFPTPSYTYEVGQDEGTVTIEDNIAVLKDKDGKEISDATGKITYSVESSDNDFAILGGDENSSGIIVNTNKEGTATVTATFDAAGTDEKYSTSTATYTIKVTKRQTTLSFGEAYDGKTINVNLGDEFTAPTATLTPNIEGETIKYSSNKPTVATVDETTGAVTIVGAGTTDITADFVGDDTYGASTASYTIKVVDPNTLVFSDDYNSFDKILPGGYSTAATPLDYSLLANNGNNYTFNLKYSFRNDNGIQMQKSSAGAGVVISPKFGFSYGYTVTIEYTSGNGITLSAGDKTVTGTDVSSISLTTTSDIPFTIKTGSQYAVVKTIRVAPNSAPKAETLTTSAGGYATYSADYAVNYSELGLTVYTLTVDETNKTVTAKEFTGVVPAGKAVLVKGTASTTYTLIPATTEGDATFATDLQTGATTADGTQYGFTSKSGTPAFAQVVSGQDIPAKKGYIVLKGASAAKYSICFDDEATGIHTIEAASAANDAMYNLAGQRVDKAYKGIVIVNGKKYLNK